MDRVSFRLLIYILIFKYALNDYIYYNPAADNTIFSVLFGIAYTATPFSPGTGCNYSAFAVHVRFV